MSQTRIFLHVKTGGHYILLQDVAVLEENLQPMVAYRHIDGGCTWVRPYKEFFDGRYKEIRLDEKPVNLDRADVVGGPLDFPVAGHNVRTDADNRLTDRLRRSGFPDDADRVDELIAALEGMT